MCVWERVVCVGPVSDLGVGQLVLRGRGARVGPRIEL